MKKYINKKKEEKKCWPFRAFSYLFLFVVALIVVAGISSGMSTDDTTLIAGLCQLPIVPN